MKNVPRQIIQLFCLLGQYVGRQIEAGTYSAIFSAVLQSVIRRTGADSVFFVLVDG